MYSRFFAVFWKFILPKPLLKLELSKQRQTDGTLERSWRLDLPVGPGSRWRLGAIQDFQETGTPRGKGQPKARRGQTRGSNLALSLQTGAGAGVRRAR